MNLFRKETPNIYKYWIGNYNNLNWLLSILEFRKKQDSMSMFMTPFVKRTDRIIYQVAFTPVDEAPWIFCVTSKASMNVIFKQYFDIVIIFNVELFL
jgi:hypothetical protein